MQAFFTVPVFERRSTRNAAVAARAAQAQGRTLTREQRDAIRDWDGIYNGYLPAREEVQKEIDDYRGGYVRTFQQRLKLLRAWNFLPAVLPTIHRHVGDDADRDGPLQARRAAGRPPDGLLCARGACRLRDRRTPNALSVYGMFSSNFEVVVYAFWNVPHHAGRVAVALAHAAVIVMVVKSGALGWLTDRLAAVGQTALSNYIATSVVCALLFYTPGFGLMGQLQRYQLYGVVVGIWILNLAWSPWWLRRYRFGPLEWCWRSLTYWKRQPSRVRSPAGPAPLPDGVLRYP